MSRDMIEGVSESRFYMWRAVFAMVHADHVVAPQERAFMENYLKTVAFSQAQAEILRADIAEPQDIGEMFAGITGAEDRGEFFQFARELLWCDGDMDAQEEAIKKRLLDNQMFRLNLPALERELRATRREQTVRRDADLSDLRQQARELVGLSAFLRGMANGNDGI